MADKIIACADCSQEFVFSESEQAFYADKGFTEPRRCASCRAIRKSQRGDSGSGDRGGYSSAPREFHTAICASCGNEARLPFVPSGDRPVYCSDCFRR